MRVAAVAVTVAATAAALTYLSLFGDEPADGTTVRFGEPVGFVEVTMPRERLEVHHVYQPEYLRQGRVSIPRLAVSYAFWVALVAVGSWLAVRAVWFVRGHRRVRLAVVAASLVLLAWATTVYLAFAVPATAHSRADARSLEHGLPFRWATGDYGFLSPPGYPQTYGFNPWENPTEFDGPRFLASWAAVLALLVAGVVGLRALLRRTR